MTLEEHVAYGLLNLYKSRDAFEVISFHPPSGKAYETALVRFPVLANLGIASKRRHLDFIVRCNKFLILQELKGEASGLGDDYIKLIALRNELGLDGILKTIAKRVPSILGLPKITKIILSVGYSKDDSIIPSEFTSFCVKENGDIKWHWGDNLDLQDQQELNCKLSTRQSC